MRKVFAILLLSLLLFNWCGYRLVTSILSVQSSSTMEAMIDSEAYDESELVEVRVSLRVPYQLNQPDFERFYGEVEVDGRYYTYVKRKIENGQLVLLCLPNSHKEKIQAAGQDYYKNTNGLDHLPGEKKSNTVQKNTMGDFDDRLLHWDMNQLQVSVSLTAPACKEALSIVFFAVPVQPPEQA